MSLCVLLVVPLAMRVRGKATRLTGRDVGRPSKCSFASRGVGEEVATSFLLLLVRHLLLVAMHLLLLASRKNATTGAARSPERSVLAPSSKARSPSRSF